MEGATDKRTPESPHCDLCGAWAAVRVVACGLIEMYGRAKRANRTESISGPNTRQATPTGNTPTTYGKNAAKERHFSSDFGPPSSAARQTVLSCSSSAHGMASDAPPASTTSTTPGTTTPRAPPHSPCREPGPTPHVSLTGVTAHTAHAPSHTRRPRPALARPPSDPPQPCA
eukprot:5545282-Prymnesium_polylepis.1